MIENSPKSVGSRAWEIRLTSFSPRCRYSINWATLIIVRSCFAANFSRSGMRDIVPSSFIISQMTLAG